MSPATLKAALGRSPPSLEDGRPLQLVDVRESPELAISSLPGFTHLPLSRAGAWLPTVSDELDPEAPTAVLCHHGMRSARVGFALLGEGFAEVYNVEGGIDAYARKVDPDVPTY